MGTVSQADEGKMSDPMVRMSEVKRYLFSKKFTVGEKDAMAYQRSAWNRALCVAINDLDDPEIGLLAIAIKGAQDESGK